MRALLVGGSGLVGAPLAAALLAQGAEVVVLSRAARAARERLPPGVEVVQGDLIHRRDVERAADGCDAMALISPVSSSLADVELTAVAVAQARGMERVVKLGCGLAAGAVAAQHAAVEQALAASGVPWLGLRPSYLLQNTLRDPLREMIADRQLVTPLKRGRFAAVDARDVAACMAACLVAEEPDGRVFEPTGPALVGMRDVADALSRVLPSSVRFATVPAWATQLAMWTRGADPFEIAHTLQLVKAVAAGAGPPVTDDVEMLTGHAPRTLAAFCEEHVEAWSSSG